MRRGGDGTVGVGGWEPGTMHGLPSVALGLPE
jgi:hypothetical protein